MISTKLKAAIACGLVGCLAVGSATAAYTSEITTVNRLAIDVVDIEARGSAESDTVALVSGDPATAETLIENKGVACWVRVRLESPEEASMLTRSPRNIDESAPMSGFHDAPAHEDASGYETEANALEEDPFESPKESPANEDGQNDADPAPPETNGAHPDPAAAASAIDADPLGTDELAQAIEKSLGRWIEGADGCFYLARPLGEGETAIFSETVTFSPDEAWDGAGFETELYVVVEAVQASAFFPSFDDDRPWGDLAPIKTDRARTGGSVDEA